MASGLTVRTVLCDWWWQGHKRNDVGESRRAGETFGPVVPPFQQRSVALAFHGTRAARGGSRIPPRGTSERVQRTIQIPGRDFAYRKL